MKKKIIILSPMLIGIMLFIISCCKEGSCVNKLAGKYKCVVSGYSYSSNEPNIPLPNSNITQEVSLIDDSTLILNISIGSSNELYDTVNINGSSNNDTINFNNSNHLILTTNPVRFLRGFFVKNKIYIEYNLAVAPSNGKLYVYNGKKKLL